jgi:hypothetical protein
VNIGETGTPGKRWYFDRCPVHRQLQHRGWRCLRDYIAIEVKYNDNPTEMGWGLFWYFDRCPDALEKNPVLEYLTLHSSERHKTLPFIRGNASYSQVAHNRLQWRCMIKLVLWIFQQSKSVVRGFSFGHDLPKLNAYLHHHTNRPYTICRLSLLTTVPPKERDPRSPPCSVSNPLAPATLQVPATAILRMRLTRWSNAPTGRSGHFACPN